MKQTGKIKWFSTKKGYGFIAPENRLKDIFITQVCIRSGWYK